MKKSEATGLTFAEAVRKGYETLKPHRGDYFRFGAGGVCEGACLLGAGYYGSTRDATATEGTIINYLLTFYPEMDRVVTHPVYQSSFNASAAIADLNDVWGWSAECILAWYSKVTKTVETET